MANRKWRNMVVACVALVMVYVLGFGGCGRAPARDEVSARAAPGQGRRAQRVAVTDRERAAAPRPPTIPVPTPPPSTPEPEYLLAAIQAGERVEATDFRVTVFASLLDRLEAKTVNSRSNIADIIVRTSEMAARDGRPISVLGVAQALDTSIPPEAAGIGLKLEEVAAVWLALYGAGG